MVSASSPLLTLSRQPNSEQQDYFLRVHIDGREKYYQIRENKTHFYKVLWDWMATTSGEKKILKIAREALKGVSLFFQESNSRRSTEIVEGIEVASKVVFFASIWNNIKAFGETGSEFSKAVAGLIQEIAKRYFPLSACVNQESEAVSDEDVWDKLKDVSLKGERLLFSGCFLVKDIAKVIQAVVMVPFQFLQVFLKFLSPALIICVLSYDGEKLLTHIKERKAVEQATMNLEDLEKENRYLRLTQEVTKEEERHDYIATALDATHLAIIIIGFAAVAFLGAMPPVLGIALSITYLLALLASCANKISQNMISGTFKEVKDERTRAELLALQDLVQMEDDGAGVGVA